MINRSTKVLTFLLAVFSVLIAEACQEIVVLTTSREHFENRLVKFREMAELGAL